jgi:hypothetical protein
MINPSKSSENFGEWIELFNISQDPLNISGWKIYDDSGESHVISPSEQLIIEPQAYLVLGRSKESNLNGGVKVDYSYGEDISLDNDSDSVYLADSEGELIDVIIYSKSTLPVEEGKSLNLEPPENTANFTKFFCTAKVPISGESDSDLGTPGKKNTCCDNDGDGMAEDDGDCNDENSSISPGSQEVCNGIDDNCNGKTDEAEEFDIPDLCLKKGVCSGTVPFCMGEKGWNCIYPITYNKEKEIFCDGLDNDCDGDTDEPDDLVLDVTCKEQGVCKGTKAVCDGKNGWTCPYPEIYYQETETFCDGMDNDCDGLTDEDMKKGENCISGTGECAKPGKTVCDSETKLPVCDAKPLSSEGRIELCGDGIDNDCDGKTDEDFPVGEKCSAGEGECRVFGKYRCSADLHSVECNAVTADEICSDGIDNNCDGFTDEVGCIEKEIKNKIGCGIQEGNQDRFFYIFLLILLVLKNHYRKSFSMMKN